jgi:hypothetical protein
MSKRDHFARVAALACALACGCASGGLPRLGDDDIDASTGKHDAPITFDATPPVDGMIDAMVIPDAMMPPDAGNPAFCFDNTMCTVAGTCCFFGQCKPGVAGGTNLCFPN